MAAYLANKKAKLRHEHIVPRSVVMKRLFELKEPTANSVQDICERFLVAAIVTPHEDSILSVNYMKDMPPDFYEPSSPNYHDPWLRYRKYPDINIGNMPPHATNT